MLIRSTLLLLFPLLPSTLAQDPKTRTTLTLQALQEWYNAQTGLWNTCGWWNSANVLTMLANLAKADPTHLDLVKNVAANTFANAPAHNPQPGVENPAPAKVQGRMMDRRSQPIWRRKVAHIAARYDKSIDRETGITTTTYDKDWVRTEVYSSGYIGPQKFVVSSTVGSAANGAAQWLDGFYDDDAWWALAFLAVFDVTQNGNYLSLASDIFDALTKAGPTNCNNGGIWWSWKRDYVNAIANELFLSLAAHLANRVSADRKQYYVDQAKKQLDWFQRSGMINERGTINDGLTADCKNNGFTVWSYNQGVILGALAELHRAAPDPSYLTLAAKIAKSAIAELSDQNGVLHDKCGPNCGGDASQFKGIFVRGLQSLHEEAPDAAYVATIQRNAESVWANDRDEKERLSTDWAGPFVQPANASTHSSAMEALVAALVVR